MAFTPVLIERFKEAWKSETEQYALRTKKAPKSSPGQGEFRWITIGAEAGADGEHHGGHHVMIDSQGVMQTGAFRGKTMGEAFGKDGSSEKPQQPGIQPVTRANEVAKPGDQLGLFGEAARPKRDSAPELAQGGETKGKQKSLFDTKGSADQSLLFATDDATPEDMVGDKSDVETDLHRRQEIANSVAEGESILKAGGNHGRKYSPEQLAAVQRSVDNGNKKLGLSSITKKDEQDSGPIPFRDRKAFAAKLAAEGKLHSEIIDAMVARGVAIVDARRLSAGALGDMAQGVAAAKSTLPEGWSESTPGGMATNGKGDIVDREIKSGKWFAIHDGPPLTDFASRQDVFDALKSQHASSETSRPEATNSPSVETNSPRGSVESPKQLDTPETPVEKASSTFESSIDKGDTPRQAAEAAQKKLDDDYEFARASEVRNAGEDLKGSARHKVNAWRSLDDAEKNGTAAELVTRDQLLRNEPHNLMIHADRNPLTALAMHFAMKAFPGKPGTGRAGDHVKDRKQFLEAYRSVKEKAEDLAKSKEDGFAAIRELQSHVSKLIAQFRGQTSQGAIGISTASDKYNQTANDLVGLTKALQSYGAARSSVKGRLNEFAAAVQEKYGTPLDEIGRSGSSDAKQAVLDMAAEHAKDIIDGKSLNATFGKESKKSNRFDPSEMYVKIAERKGGRDLSKVVSDPNKSTDHMVKEMGLRGVQWGNSVTDEERKHHAAKAVEALTDLADTLGLHPKDITLDGSLGLAIGARGRGGAVAHYEPDSKVINLTRKNGVGSLAHEWAHGFDHYLGNFKSSAKDGPVFMSRRSGYTHTVTSPDGYSSDVDEKTASRHLNSQSRFKVAEMKDAPLRKAFQQLASMQSDYRTRLSDHLRALVKEGWMTHEKARDYWQSESEIFARTFERYVQHKIESSGRKNTYLAGIETKGHKAGGLWPTDDEVKQMAPAFDALFTEYRKQKHGSPDVVKFSRREAERAFMPVFQPVLIERY